MILHFQAADDFTIAKNSRNRFSSNLGTNFDNITPSGENNMSLIITRLSELSDALQNVSLYPEAEVVQSHINRLNSEEYNDLISNLGLEAVLTELTNDFN